MRKLAAHSVLASLMLLACLGLSGCSGVLIRAYQDDPALAAAMKTDDPQEMRRRFGDYVDFVDKGFVRVTGENAWLFKYRWLVTGATLEEDSRCLNAGCIGKVTLIQWDSATGKLYQTRGGEPDMKGLRETYEPQVVQPDGSVAQGSDFSIRFDRAANAMVRHTPRGIFTANGHSPEVAELMFNDARSTFRAQAREDQRRSNEMLGAIAGGLSAAARDQAVMNQRHAQLQSGGGQAMLSAPRPSAQTTGALTSAQPASSRTSGQSPTTAAISATASVGSAVQVAASTNQPQAPQSARTSSAASTTSARPQSSQANARPAPVSNSSAGRSQHLAALGSQSPAGSAQVDIASPEKAAAPSRGPARAWCMKKPNQEFLCNGPLQNGGWGTTLKAALSMVDCPNGSGYTPTVGTGGKSFDCGRELRASEQVMPTYDPFHDRDKQFGAGK